MVKHPEWGSSQDPRHLAEVFDERNNTLRPVSSSFNAFYNTMPEEMKKASFNKSKNSAGP